MCEERTQVPLGSRMCWAVSWGTGECIVPFVHSVIIQSRGILLCFLSPCSSATLVTPHKTPVEPPFSIPLDSSHPRTIYSSLSPSPPTLLNTILPPIYGSSLDLSWISPLSHRHPSLGPSLIPFSCFSCFTFISAPLLLCHLVFPFLASIFDPLYHP